MNSGLANISSASHNISSSDPILNHISAVKTILYYFVTIHFNNIFHICSGIKIFSFGSKNNTEVRGQLHAPAAVLPSCVKHEVASETPIGRTASV